MLHLRPGTTVLLGTALLTAACASTGDREVRSPAGPAGQVLRVEAANGGVSRLRFRRDGQVVATFGERSLTGGWTLDDGRLCFRWTGAAPECWPYQGFEQGRTVTVRSDRGNVVRVTRQ